MESAGLNQLHDENLQTNKREPVVDDLDELTFLAELVDMGDDKYEMIGSAFVVRVVGDDSFDGSNSFVRRLTAEELDVGPPGLIRLGLFLLGRASRASLSILAKLDRRRWSRSGSRRLSCDDRFRGW